MDTKQLRQLLSFDRFTKLYFRGACAKNQLPTRIPSRHDPSIYIVNLDSSHLPGSHWIALYLDPKRGGEYFDSYGLKPIKECLYLLNQCPEIKYNNILLQDDTLVCGQYCVIFAMLRSRGYSFLDIIRAFDHPLNDAVVYNLIRAYFPSLPFKSGW